MFKGFLLLGILFSLEGILVILSPKPFNDKCVFAGILYFYALLVFLCAYLSERVNDESK